MSLPRSIGLSSYGRGLASHNASVSETAACAAPTSPSRVHFVPHLVLLPFRIERHQLARQSQREAYTATPRRILSNTMDLVSSMLTPDGDVDCGLLGVPSNGMEAFSVPVDYTVSDSTAGEDNGTSPSIDAGNGGAMWEFPDDDLLSVPNDHIDLASLGAGMPQNVGMGSAPVGAANDVDDAMAFAEALISTDCGAFDSFCLAPNVAEQQQPQMNPAAASGPGQPQTQPETQPQNQPRTKTQTQTQPQLQSQPQPQPQNQLLTQARLQSQPQPQAMSQLQMRPAQRTVEAPLQENRLPRTAGSKSQVGAKAQVRKGKAQSAAGNASEAKWVAHVASRPTVSPLKNEDPILDDDVSTSSIGKPRDRSTQRKLRNKESARRYREKQVAKRRQLENFTRNLAEQNRELESLHEKLLSLTCGHAPVGRPTSQMIAGPLQDLNQ